MRIWTHPNMLKAAVGLALLLWVAEGEGQTLSGQIVREGPPPPTPMPDPDRLWIASLSFSPAVGIVGQAVTAHVKVFNNTDSALTNIRWAFSVGTNEATGVLGSIASKSTAEFTHVFTPVVAGTFRVGASTDLDRKVSEPIQQRVNNSVQTDFVVLTGTSSQWNQWAQHLASASHHMLEEATKHTRIRNGVIDGQILRFQLEVVGFDGGWHQTVRLPASMPPAVKAVSSEAWEAYKAWVAGYKGLHTTAFPSFTCFPVVTAQAPPTPMVMAPIAVTGVSSATTRLTPLALENAIRARLGNLVNEPGAGAAMKGLSVAIAGQFVTGPFLRTLFGLGSGTVQTDGSLSPCRPVVGTVLVQPSHLM